MEGTSYNECYETFLSGLEDAFIIYPMEGESDEEFEERLNEYLFALFKKGVSKFFNSKTSLERDDKKQEFANKLRPVEVEIIAMLMTKEYYMRQLNFLVAQKGSFSDKDWKSHDKSNQMNQYRQIIKEKDKEILNLTLRNSYVSANGGSEGWTS